MLWVLIERTQWQESGNKSGVMQLELGPGTASKQDDGTGSLPCSHHRLVACRVAEINQEYKGPVYRACLLRLRRQGQAPDSLCRLPLQMIELIRRSLDGNAIVAADEVFGIIRSRPHDNLAAVVGRAGAGPCCTHRLREEPRWFDSATVPGERDRRFLISVSRPCGGRRPFPTQGAGAPTVCEESNAPWLDG